MEERDKTKEYITEYETYKIIMFWIPETKSIAAGWAYKVINK